VFSLFLPGVESQATHALPRLPALERLLARGRARPLEHSPWAFLAQLAGGDLARWPVAPVSALAELEALPGSCLRVEPLGAAAEQQLLFRLPASGLGIQPDEAHALAAAFLETFREDGLRLEIAAPERWYLAWELGHAHAPDWRGFSAPAQFLDADERPAPPEAHLRRLLSEVELLFHAHPVNTRRRERSAPIIAGLHAWGGGRLAGDAARRLAAPQAGAEPYLEGLRSLGVIAGAPSEMDEDGVAWPSAIETIGVAELTRIEQDWAVPLLRRLRRGRLGGVRIVTGRAVHETRRTDALRFWRRPRPVAELC
jgi:hypothetical protein